MKISKLIPIHRSDSFLFASLFKNGAKTLRIVSMSVSVTNKGKSVSNHH